MPFTKRGNSYYSPSGKRYTKEQVEAYYASKKKKKRRKKKKKLQAGIRSVSRKAGAKKKTVGKKQSKKKEKTKSR